MGVGAEVLGCFLYSSPKGSYRNPWPALVEFFDRRTIRKHIDHLGNPDPSAPDGEFTACPLFARLEISHSINIVAINRRKVKEWTAQRVAG